MVLTADGIAIITAGGEHGDNRRGTESTALNDVRENIIIVDYRLPYDDLLRCSPYLASR